jgi:hypothetical protein
MQLETMLFFYEHKLQDIQGNICDILELVQPHPLLVCIQKSSLQNLYAILSEKESLFYCDDIVDPDQLATLCHNYSLISQALDSYYRINNIVRIDHRILRSIRLSPPSMN